MEVITPLLVKLFGPVLARVLLAALLQNRVEFSNTSSDELADILVDSLDIGSLVDKMTDGDWKARRVSERVFDRIGEEAAERLAPLFQSEQMAIPEAERTLAIEAAKETLNRRALRLLYDHNFDGYKFRHALRREVPAAPLETEAQQLLYERLLDTSAQVVFAVADQLPHFTRDTTAILLQNEDNLLQQSLEVLEGQQKILAETYGQQIANEAQFFESEYRTAVVKALNNLELFGVEKFDGARQPLTVAYIQLKVAKDEQPAIHARSFEGEKSEASLLAQKSSLPVEEALSMGNRLLVVAKAGAGKTTLLKWLGVQAARNALADPLDGWSGRIPFYLRLREYANKPLPPVSNLATSLRQLQYLAGSEPSRRWVINQIRQRRAIILLDGLDEVSSEKRREALTWLDGLTDLDPELIVVVSTRPSGLDTQELHQRLQQMAFQQIDLLELNDEQVESFVHQWHVAMQDDDCEYLHKSILPEKEERLLQAFANRDNLLDLARTPLLCSMLCALHLFELGELPQDRIRLYNRCIHILLRRDENRQIQTDEINLRAETMRRLLARIAYWMLRDNPNLIYREDAESILRKEGLSATAVLNFIATRSVVFRQQAVDEFDFIHRTFQEFLAAQQIVSSHEVALYVRQYGKDSEWHETIRLIAGHAEPADQATLLEALFELSQQHVELRRDLHFLAWEFWDLLDDTRTEAALKWMKRHARSLNLFGAAGLNLSLTQVSDVSALAALTNLQQLDLWNTQVSDVSALAALTNLQQLDLSGTQVSDVSALAALTNLQQLDLSGTQVSDVSALAALTNLQQLNLSYTQVSDVSVLVALTNLQQLNLWNTQVSDVSALAALTNLQQLNLSYTQVSDVSALAALTNLQQLNLSYTQVSDVSALAALLSSKEITLTIDAQQLQKMIDQLRQISNLRLGVHDVSDVSALAALTNLQQLNLSYTQVSDVSVLAALTNLQQLNLWNMQVSDVSVLAALTNLQQLNLWNTQVSDVSALAALTNLQQLDLSGTQVSDVNALAALTNLRQLNLSLTQVSDVSALAALTNLRQLNLGHTQVSDVSALAALTNLQQLDLSGTQVSDVSALAALTNLQQLNLWNMQVSDVSALAALTNLQQLNLSLTQVSDVSALAALTNLQQLDLSGTLVSDVNALAALTNLIVTSG